MEFAVNWIMFSAIAIAIGSSIETRKFANQVFWLIFFWHLKFFWFFFHNIDNILVALRLIVFIFLLWVNMCDFIVSASKAITPIEPAENDDRGADMLF